MKLQLTPSGEIANKYGAVVPPAFFQDALKIAKDVNEYEDYRFAFSQMIYGLIEMQERFYEIIGEE